MYIAQGVFRMVPSTPITAIFRDGAEISYTARVISWLINEPSVEYVYDSETGEILFHR